MKLYNSTLTALALGATMLAAPLALADDIDIFTGSSAGLASKPRILIILDNTSNWSRADQAFNSGAPSYSSIKQGEAEVMAIINSVPKLGADVQVGVMEFNTNGTKSDNGGFIRSAVLPMGTSASRGGAQTNYEYLKAQMTTIYGDINGPKEKGPSGMGYGNLLYDAHNYFAGGSSFAPGALDADRADEFGYTSPYSTFKSPLTAGETCGKNFIIFIGNPDPNGPTPDEAANLAALTTLNGGAVTPLLMPASATGTSTTRHTIGTTAACYASSTLAAAGLTAFTTQCAAMSEGCAIGTAAPSVAKACAAGTSSYTVVQSTNHPAGGAPPVVGAAQNTTAPSTGFYAGASSVPASDRGTLVCPANTSSTVAGVTLVTTYSCSYSTGAAVGSSSATTATATASSCYKGVSSAQNNWDSATTTDFGGLNLTCPVNNVCTYSGATGAACGGQKYYITVTRTATPKTKFTITQSAVPTTTSSAAVPAYTSTKVLGTTAGCYASAPASTTDFSSQCVGIANVSCTYNNAPTSSSGSFCAANTSQYSVIGTDIELTATIEDGTIPDQVPGRYADEWAKMLYQKGVRMAGSAATDFRPSVTTYTIDVYNKKPSADHSSLLLSMAKNGGGKYFVAKDANAIVDALTNVFAEIQAVNSSFASTSLPVSATNRSQNANQVFIGMFRPDPEAKPRWFGNLKRYQLINGAGGTIELGDAKGKAAVNNQTGFVTPCAFSYWTVDSKQTNGKGYWDGVTMKPDPVGTCDLASVSLLPYSDAPDGQLVEKGGAAQMLRQGNGVAGVGLPGDWNTLNRNMYTQNGSSDFVPFTAASIGLADADLVNFTKGADVMGEKGTVGATTTRPSIHGDVIHSRPLPINHSGNSVDEVVVYYGANDGAFRAVDADSGKELWSFVASEHANKLMRLKSNTELVTYANSASGTTTPKDYFFDGSTGVYQDETNTNIWIYPTMRRGGRMIYAVNAKTKATPKFMWKAGCRTDGIEDCTDARLANIGQTWSTPVVAFIKGYSDTKPVLIVGGGYDDLCEDQDAKVSSCATPKGNAVYLFDAKDGTLLTTVPTDRSVAGDVALADVDNDGKADYAYAATTGGGIYRIDFINGPTTRVALPIVAGATVLPSRKVATTASADGRKFLFAPALFTSKSMIYVAIGSGDREHPLAKHYAYAGVTNRMYVYMDDPSLPVGTAAQNLDDKAAGMMDVKTDLGCAAPKVIPGSGRNGWFLDMAPGEQVVTSALISGGMVIFSTNRPLPEATGTCATSLGEARGYWVNLLNGAGGIGVDGTCGGSRSAIFAGGGLPPSPVLASSVKVGGKAVSVIIGAVKKLPGGIGSGVPPVIGDPGPGGGVGGSSGSGGPAGTGPIDAQLKETSLTRKRKRTYIYTSGD
ncbi:MAG: PilC/PilY family type IV pilus protein [Pseudomonadota bacterium]